MKQLWINDKPVQDEEGNPYEAERIEFGDDEIVGYNGRSEVFALRGLHPDRNTYEVRDEARNRLEPDRTEIAELKAKLSDVEKATGIDGSGTKGIARRIDALEARIAKLER